MWYLQGRYIQVETASSIASVAIPGGEYEDGWGCWSFGEGATVL